MEKEITFTVSEKENQKRVDVLVFERLKKLDKSISRNRLDAFFKGNVKVNGKECKKGLRVSRDDEITVEVEDVLESIKSHDIDTDTIVATKGKLKIIEETPDYLVINKEKGVPVHPGKGNTKKTVANFVKQYLQSKNEYDESIKRGGIVHRLDKGVSGLMIIAKTRVAQEYFQREFEQRRVDKVYLASLVEDKVWEETGGGVNEELDKLIKENFIPDKRWIKVEGYIRRDRTNRMRMQISPIGKGKYSLSYVLPLSNRQALILIKTGRMHQIRASLKTLDLVIEGDHLYGNVKNDGKLALEEVYLRMKDTEGELREWRLV